MQRDRETRQLFFPIVALFLVGPLGLDCRKDFVALDYWIGLNARHRKISIHTAQVRCKILSHFLYMLFRM